MCAGKLGFPYHATVPSFWPLAQKACRVEEPGAHHPEPGGRSRSPKLLGTNARGWAGLPEESVLDLHAADLRASLQSVAWVALEHGGITSFPAVATPTPILWNSGVIAGGCSGH